MKLVNLTCVVDKDVNFIFRVDELLSALAH